MDATRNLEEPFEKVVHRRLVLDAVRYLEHPRNGLESNTWNYCAEVRLRGKRDDAEVGLFPVWVLSLFNRDWKG